MQSLQFMSFCLHSFNNQKICKFSLKRKHFSIIVSWSSIISDEVIRGNHREDLRQLMMTRWEFLESPLHDAGFVLNPLFDSLKPWTNNVVMKGFNQVSSKWGGAEVLAEFDHYSSGAWKTDLAPYETVQQCSTWVKSLDPKHSMNSWNQKRLKVKSPPLHLAQWLWKMVLSPLTRLRGYGSYSGRVYLTFRP